ncbi:MAG: lipid A biosynthesis lauroyl acyltransferase [Alphaproteobacteria bacterium]
MANASTFRRYVQYPLEAAAAAVIYGFFRLLPLDAASATGGWLFRVVGPRLGLSRIAYHNLERAFPEKTPAELRAIVVGMWDNLGRVLGEYAHIEQFDFVNGEKIRIEGVENIALLRDDGLPGILFTAHLANWELAHFAMSYHGLPLAVVYRAANNPLVEWLIRRGRGSGSGELVPKGTQGARRLMETLRKGGHLGMLLDQKMNDGIPVPFFGRDAMTATAVAQFVYRYRCPLVPVRVERLEGTRFRITVMPPMELPDTGDHHADVFETLRRINELYESWIRERPEQWLWVHRRWPDYTRPR